MLTRSDLLRGAGAALVGGAAGMGRRRAGAQPRADQPGAAPDLVLLGAKVYTVDDARPRAEAFAVKDGRFVAVGTSAEMRALVRPGTRVIDGAGATVTPGFIDAHSHPASAGLAELLQVDLDLRSLHDIK